MTNVVILGGARTPMTEWVGGKRGDGGSGGALKDVSALELGAIAAKGALAKTGVPADRIEHVIMGNALQTSGDAIYGARHVGLKAGVPIRVPALTVNRLCGSGIQSLINGAHIIGEGSEYVLAGGMENMTRVPFLLPDMRLGHRIGNTEVVDAMYRDGLLDPLCDLIMGETAENLVDRYGISREEQDTFALESQQKAAAAAARRADEMVPVEVRDGKQTRMVTADEHPRPDTTLETLAKLPPVFREGGSVTAGNSSGLTDGGAAMVLMDEDRATAEGRAPLARIIGWSWAGVPPEIMGIGPVPATQKVLERTGLTMADIDLIEINEAFAAQVIACERDLKFDRDKVNVRGGGISIGHPIGMSGARILLSLAYEMRHAGVSLGLATLCISGGQGLAVVLERV